MEAGQILGSYTISRKLGEGGIGTVFLAYDTTLHRPVALKVIDRAGDPESSRSRLFREARNAAALKHPNICTIHEVSHEGGTAFIAMEYVDGRTLRDRIDDTGALPRADALRFGVFAHRWGTACFRHARSPLRFPRTPRRGRNVPPRSGAAIPDHRARAARASSFDPSDPAESAGAALSTTITMSGNPHGMTDSTRPMLGLERDSDSVTIFAV
jgi:hypothetical protein